jgi:tRNA nucleotidyltransferase (CCA-adding enzyme)
MWAALCHDLGKPATTRELDGRITARAHEVRGAELSEGLLRRLRAPSVVIEGVSILVRYHLAPAQFAGADQPAGAAAYRRLARKLADVGANLELLERVARADQLGRSTSQADRGEFPEGERFLQRVRELELEDGGPSDVVLGRHLIERGYRPGPALGQLLNRCRAVQDETGWREADRILARVLREQSKSEPAIGRGAEPADDA